MREKLKNNKGITLVALVITIIVLLILAMVSIKIAIDGGLITKASKATDTHTIAAEKEAIGLGYSEYQMALANKENVTKPTIERATVTPKCQKIVNIQKTCFHMDQKMCHIKIQSLLSSTAVTTLE